MTRYKVKVTIDENNPFWIVVDNGILIRNPTQEDLKDSKFISYSDDNICPICREENNITDKSILYPRNANRDTDKNGKKTDEWVCKRHSLMHYHRYDPDSYSNIRKSMSACRMMNSKYHNKIIGDRCEELTKKWTGAKRLSVEHDKYSQLPIDHGPITKHIHVMIGDKLVDLYGKVPQTKGHSYNPKYDRWAIDTRKERNKEFDILIFYCISEDGKTVERIYIFPKEEMTKNGITISKNPSRGIQWYEKCRVTDECELNKVDEMWKKSL